MSDTDTRHDTPPAASQSWMSLADLAPVPGSGQRPLPVAMLPDTLEVTQGQVSAPIPSTLIGGALPGAVSEAIFTVYTAQLQQAPSCVLHAGYDPETDAPGVRRALEALESLGEQPAPFLCLPADGEVIELDGAQLKVFHVYTDLPLLAAMRQGRRAYAQIRIPHVRDEGQLLLLALTGHQLHRRLTTLQRCDVVAALCAPPWSYAQEQVAKHLANDDETGEAPSQSYVARLIQAARQPQEIREMLATGALKLGHVRYLAGRVASDAERIRVARYVVQDGLSIARVATVLNALYPYRGEPTAQLVQQGDRLVLDDLTAAIHLHWAPPPPYLREGLLAANPVRLAQEARKHAVVVVPNADPAKVGIAAESLATLRAWLTSVRGTISVAEVETKLLGFCVAMQQHLDADGLLSAQGKLVATTVDATASAASAPAHRA